MTDNSTHPIMDFLHAFDLRDLIVAFCMSMVVGLLLGALVYMLLTWKARRRASARITCRHTRPSRSTTRSASPRSRQGFHRSSSGYDRRSNNSLASAAFSFHRQGSSPEVDPLGHKPSFRASTFHPLLQVSQIAREAEGVSQTTPTPASTTSTPPNASKPRPDSFWGNSSLRGAPTSPTPPPAYESVIRAYQETCT
ncbi:LOW QUALITY PROTEIN: myc target protein 1 homolog [Alosa sapidissima]|uniref:LOW QUALITY PROTEIN: myc target protein 1 homolog n=1 Tax=Alosa sapidissima TaxID=34773 RepID=UPI001C086746|nr:LOW QUALITY PROTEIN: myc target protein 1 homolog [Alosa sapidissima]